jgi:hypothetical protein
MFILPFLTCLERHRAALTLVVQCTTGTAIISSREVHDRHENQQNYQMALTIRSGKIFCVDKIWDTADTLRGAGIKASQWLGCMLPSFALMMIESRLWRFCKSRIEELKTEEPAYLQWLNYAAIAANMGYPRDLLSTGADHAACIEVGFRFQPFACLWREHSS